MTEGIRAARQLYLIGAGAVVLAPDDRILMLEQERAGKVEWEGPGGALEGNESPAACAVRETAEECGLIVRVDRLLRVSEYWEGGRFVGIGFLFLARPDPWPQDVRLLAQDGATRFLSYRWCSRAEVDALEDRWAYDITRTAWPPDITAPIFDRLDLPVAVVIRQARPEEAEALRELAHRSKAYWPYDAEFLKAVAPMLTLEPRHIAEQEVHVLELDGAVAGWHRVTFYGERAELEDLWLEPARIGAGHGRTLFEHAVRIALDGGATRLEWDAEPYAEGFYRAMGGKEIGRTPSAAEPGRTLPRMRLTLI